MLAQLILLLFAAFLAVEGVVLPRDHAVQDLKR